MGINLIPMLKRKLFVGLLALALAAPAAVVGGIALTAQNGDGLSRPEGPCDVYAKGGTPCVAAHSSTRALSASYNGPLYQIMRASDGKTLDIGVVQPSAGDPGGYADAAAQDEFCAGTTCWITILYDQTGNGNDLYQAPRGGFSGPAMGGFNNVPVADWAPVSLGGHKVYGVFIAPGMGLRWNDPKGTAVDDQAEGQYWVISGHHYNDGCCFDYGNAETDSRDDGDGTMETTYFGNSLGWYHGAEPGPWVMTDQENNLVGCVNPDPNDRYCPTLEPITWRFVTATADGEPHHWRSMAGNAQEGELSVLYDGVRVQNPRSSYDPMRKQGAILLGNGGDNSNGSSGTFYEAAMTAAGTFPTEAVNQAIQANVVAARYDVPALTVAPVGRQGGAGAVITFTPRSKGEVNVIFTNTTDEEINGLQLKLATPRRWKAKSGGSKTAKLDYALAPGQTAVVPFVVKTSRKAFNGDLGAVATWKSSDGVQHSEKTAAKVRNVQPVKINEVAGDYIELYNAGTKPVKIGGWTLTGHAAHIPYFSCVKIDKDATLAPGGFYLLGMSASGLAVPAEAGDDLIYLRNAADLSGEIMIGGEVCRVKDVYTVEPKPMAPGPRGPRVEAVGVPTTVWQPLPEGPVITIPAGSTNIPVTSTDGMRVGGKLALGYGATYPAVSNSLEKYEVVTITEVGKPGTQAWLSMDAKAGDTNIKVSSTENISVGDKIRLDIASVGHGIETVTVKAVGTPSVRSTFGGPLKPGEDPGTGLELEEPLKFNHSSNMPFSVNGTGVSFEPATEFDHSSNEPVLALAYVVQLEEPLAQSHPIDEAVVCLTASTGYKGEVAADQTFGGPAITGSGNLTLRDAAGNVADALNYGLVTDPWLSEGWQGESGRGASGNHAPSPVYTPNRRARTPAPATPVAVSIGRYPDGNDTDDNKADFKAIRTTGITEAAEAGSNVLTVPSPVFFEAGASLIIDGEPVKVASVSEPRRVSTEMRWGTTVRKVEFDVVDVTLDAALKQAHAVGAVALDNIPTPGKPNVY